MAKLETLRLVGIPETNKVMMGELSRLSGRLRLPRTTPKKAGTGTLLYPFSTELAAVATRYHRTSSRVLWDLYGSRANRLEPLYEELLSDASSDDRPWCWDGAKFSIRARNVGDFASSPGQLVGAVKNALVDGAKQRGIAIELDADNPDILIALRDHDGELSVSLDLSGQARHLRGYRLDAGDAPLRENLAAVLVMLSRWDARGEALIDPMCGSGTIAIEAALMARGVPVCEPVALQGVDWGESPGDLFGDTRAVVLANEIHTPLVDAVRANADRAGADVRVQHGDFRNWSPERVMREAGQSGVILVNPPYGGRLEVDEELGLYRDFGKWCREFSGYRVGILCGHPDFKSAFFGGRPRVQKPLRNGSLRAYFYSYDL